MKAAEDRSWVGCRAKYRHPNARHARLINARCHRPIYSWSEHRSCISACLKGWHRILALDKHDQTGIQLCPRSWLINWTISKCFVRKERLLLGGVPSLLSSRKKKNSLRWRELNGPTLGELWHTQIRWANVVCLTHPAPESTHTKHKNYDARNWSDLSAKEAQDFFFFFFC